MFAQVLAFVGLTAATGIVRTPTATQVALLQRDVSVGVGIGDEMPAEVGGLDADSWNEVHRLLMEEDKPKKKKNVTRTRQRRDNKELTSGLDRIIPLLEADFKERTRELKVALADFKIKQKQMDYARKEATVAMKALRKEAERRKKVSQNRKMTKEKERKARQEADRLAKQAMLKKAQALMGAKGSDANGMLGEVSLNIMIEVLMALPAAVENPIFIKRLNKAKNDITVDIQDFLNITRRKTGKFVLASSKASDVELSFLMARYFHEASFRVKAMQSDAQKVARDLNVVMPKQLRQSFLPIVQSLRQNAVPLRVNASSLASASLADACNQISGLMSNISDYNNKLRNLHNGLHSIWQISELMLPHMSKIYPLKTIVIDTVKDFMSLATMQTAGLQEAADEIVTNVGPVVSERMQCTWSAAVRRSSGMFALLAPLVALANWFL